MRLYRFHVLTLAIIVILSSLCPSEATTEKCTQWVAKIVSIEGSIQLRRSQESRWQTAKLNDTLCPGDMLRAPERSRAALFLINEATLRLDQNTTISFSSVESAGPAISQFVGLRAMEEGRGYCLAHLSSLAHVRQEVLSRLGSVPELLAVPPGEGAFYLFAKVRTGMPAIRLAERLIREHRVAVIPGETFGATEGCHIRIAYGSLKEETVVEGVDRLVNGLKAIVRP